ncbi:MAG TPA: helix-turn-helix transcriptional regulator [Aldersonia sp.]
MAILQDAAERLRRSGRPAREVVCLQTAAQLGDCSGADRLRDLTAAVQGPRVHAASAHAAALRDNDGEGLSAAAELYEEFGDRVAAGDAAAQSATAFRAAGLRGRSLTAAASAHRLATATWARTPAIRAASTPVPLTRRQREIISLAATGLTNREIADRLVMSVRTVEGHLFRASQKTGLNSRDELVKLLGDRH